MKRTCGSARARCPLIVPALLALLAVASRAGAQAQPPAPNPEQLLEDFVFYTLTANAELAAAHAEALIKLELTDAEMAELVDESQKTSEQRLESAFTRALKIPELEAVAADLSRRIEQGRLDMARDPARIAEAIEMLIGPQRARLLARKRLQIAGEYAVPKLLLVITEGKDERLRAQCQSMLVEIGRLAVTPLSTALLELGDPQSQRLVCDILGEIGWPHAAPQLQELARSDATAGPVREAAERALRGLQAPAGGEDLSQIYGALARQYFAEVESLIPYPYEPANNVWEYDPIVGLRGVPVPTEIYCEILAMKHSARAVRKFDPRNRDATATFVASNLKRENELPAGASDPIYGEQRYTPAFYATVFGTQTCLDVLAMAIDAVDTPLVRDAIAALAQTTGGANLFARGEGRQPLLEAIDYPDRRTQYDAALTLARALPKERFGGDFTIVPLLASAVRTGNRTFALVVADDEEDRRTIANMLEGLQFEVLGQASQLGDLQAAIAEAVGIDLVVVQKSSPDAAIAIVNELRAETRTSAAPVLLRVGALDRPRLVSEYRADRRVQVGVTRQGSEFTAQLEELMSRAAGGRMTEAEAEAYAIESMAALRDIAISNCPAYEIKEAEPALLDALDLRSGGTRLIVADILALIDSDRAQRKLIDAALASSDQDEQVELLARVADSVRHIGDRAEQRHVDALLKLVKGTSGSTAEAAATVLGAMNMAGGEAVELLPAP